MVEVNIVKNDNRRKNRYNGNKHAIQNCMRYFRAFAYGAAFVISDGSFGWTCSFVAYAQTTTPTSSKTLSISSYQRHRFNDSKHSSQQSTILESEVISPRLNPPLVYHHDHHSFDEQSQPPTRIQTLPPNTNARIYGGTPVDVLEYPYLVSLFHKVRFGATSFKCGGVLLSPDIVLTAAHCAPVDVVFTGLYDMRWFASVNRDLYWKRYNVVQQVLHPQYSTDNLDNDLCLLRIVRDESWTSLYERNYGKEREVDGAYAQLNTDPMLPVFGSTMRVIGWGATETGSKSTIPLDTTIQYGDNAYCNNQFFFPYILDSMMCGFSWNETGNDACSGDSGGPLVLKGGGEDGRDLLVGIVSWGFECGETGYPGVYARVSENIEWIESTVCGFSGVECVDGKLPQQLSATTPPTMSSTVRVSSLSPTVNSDPPTSSPTRQPSDTPSATALNIPTRIPSQNPSGAPTRKPSQYPSKKPSNTPSDYPTSIPSIAPMSLPTRLPSTLPSTIQSATPISPPSTSPSTIPTQTLFKTPSAPPSAVTNAPPTFLPGVAPTTRPSGMFTTPPTVLPSVAPAHPPTNLAPSPPSSAPTNLLEMAAQALVRSSNPEASDDYRPTVSFVTLFIISGVVFCTTCLMSCAIYKSL